MGELTSRSKGGARHFSETLNSVNITKHSFFKSRVMS